MILLLHPRTVTRLRNRRMPLSALAIAAMLEGKYEYEIVDGNIDLDPSATLRHFARERNIEALAVSVMPGPQMVHAVELCKTFRAEFPKIPIIWGGYFASLYPDAALNSTYVDYVVRGQGEDAFLALLSALQSPQTRLALDCRNLLQRRFRIARPHARPRHSFSGRFSMDAVSSLAARGEISDPDVSGRPHGGSSGQLRLPLPLQILRRCGCRAGTSEMRDAGTYGANPNAFAEAVRH